MPTRSSRLATFFLTIALVAGPPAVAFTEAATSPATATNRYGLPDFAQLVDQVGPAVVNIAVVQKVARAENGISPDDPFYDFLRRFGVPVPGMPGGPRGGGNQINRGIGSGFIVSPDGYILTNAHVVDGAAEVTVRLTDKREFKAKVIGTDKRTDVALLKVEANGLPTVRIGEAEQARVGEWVVAVGSPFGFDNTVTAGIISAKARRLPDETYVPFIQTDVAINPGNSGGPLFNLGGEVIGINSQIYSRSGGFMGISFAIPIDVAMKVKDQLQRHGKVERGRLGISIQGLDKELAQSFGLEEAGGALVASVEPGSPADKAGIKAGDVILAVNGSKVEESTDLPRIIGDMRPGSTARLQVWRDRKNRDMPVVLGAQQAEEAANKEAPRGDPQTTGKLGIAGRSLTAQEARQLGVAGGLLVEEAGGPAAKAGVRTGDVILAINNQPVTGVDQFRSLLAQAGNRFAILVQRGESRLYVPIRLN
ncbi:MAG: DegQ family serine endoprotease [Zoogloeaceae bacterium]|nr:DegQ family serine endoprotease [Zoogloeaceae bacterium]